MKALEEVYPQGEKVIRIFYIFLLDRHANVSYLLMFSFSFSYRQRLLGL